MPLATHTPDASKSQIRAAKIAGLAIEGNYEEIATALDAANLERSGLPAGKTWREAAKMSDTDLIAAIAISDELRRRRMFGAERVEY